LDELNASITEIKDSLERATEQRRAYLEEVNHCHDPVQRLPDEIAADIFSLCLPLLASLDVFDVDDETHVNTAVHPIQLLLGSVCRHWRRVVYATPQLWNILCVHISPCTSEVRSGILAQWLARSGELPLYVSMFYIKLVYDEGENEDGPQPGSIAWSSFYRMMNMLFLNANRIRVLYLSLLDSQLSCFERLQDANPATEAVTTTILERLSVEIFGDSKMGSRPNFELRGRILSPTHVSLQIIKPTQIRIQWEHVSHVEAADIPIEDALEILKIAPQLQYFKLESNENDEFYEGQLTLHSSLKSLHLDTSFLPDFLDFIKCSALEELSSHLCCDHPFALQSFIKRSKCSLKKLTLVQSTNKQLVSVLRLTPSLTHLSLKKFRFPDEFLEIFRKTAYFGQGTFARGNSQGTFLPDLRSFTCTVDFEGFQWSKILSLIPRSRADTDLVCRPLSEIEIVFSKEVSVYEARSMNHESLRQTLDLARDGGVSLKITDVDGMDLTRLFHEMYADHDEVSGF